MKRLLTALLASTFFCSPTISAVAQETVVPAVDLNKPSLFNADEISYDQKADTVTASGNVEIVQGERILKADKVIYNVKADTVQAVGNIVLMEPSGDVLFADKVDLSNEMKTGAIDQIRILFTDNTSLRQAPSGRMSIRLS